MFHKLHRQMTLFCAVVTGAILLALSLVCLFISENALRTNSYTSFLNEANSAITHLAAQDTVSLQWINRLREKNGLMFLLYDNGNPLFLQHLTAPEAELGKDFIARTAESAAARGVNVLAQADGTLTRHVEFTQTDSDGTSCYVSAGTIPKKHGTLSFLIFYSLRGQEHQIFLQRLAFLGAGLAGLFLLFVFSWFFTGKMLRPLEENMQKQTCFVASASHELRTPLTVILSGLEALEKAKTPADRAHFSSILRHESIRMQQLISDMLSLANSENHSLSLSVSPCQPDELVLAAYEKYELLAKEKGILLKMEVQEMPMPDYALDADRIGQVLSILLDNALSYTLKGGSVTVGLTAPSNLQKRKKTPHLGPRHPADSNHAKDSLCFFVSDTGPGVPDAEKELIFDRFYRSDTSHTGKDHFGLGLCIAKEIVTAHRGTILVSDAPSGGACFKVIL